MEIVGIDITRNVCNDLYRRIIDFAVGRFPMFVFVVSWRRTRAGKVYENKVSDSVREIISLLEPYLIKRFDTNEWPGTRIFGGTVELFQYHLNDDSANVLTRHSRSLFQWELPNLPRDLSIMRNPEQPWLCTIAHERVSTLYVTQTEKAELLDAIPELSEYLAEEHEPRAYYS
jgi:hypothetical protein